MILLHLLALPVVEPSLVVQTCLLATTGERGPLGGVFLTKNRDVGSSLK